MSDTSTPSTRESVRIVIADDHELVRAGVEALLSLQDDFDVVGSARDGHQLLQMLEGAAPHVVLCDLGMPGLDGLECVSRMSRERPDIRVIVLSMDDSSAAVRIALDKGAAGYVVKQSATDELCAAVRAVARGGRYLSAVVTRKLLLESNEDPKNTLTRRQVEILGHVAQGRSSRQIAALLALSPKTVDVHRARIIERLEVRDIAGLTRYAMRHRLVS